MDWDLKMPVSWDLAELEHDAVPAIAAAAPATAAASGIAAAAAVASARGPPSHPECSVDLKLGGLGEFGEPDVLKEPAAKGPMVSVSTAAVVPSASPLKRPRAGPGGAGEGQCPSCAVDGCKADLSKCRDYHRRHKVCEAHSKTPVIVVSGQEGDERGAESARGARERRRQVGGTVRRHRGEADGDQAKEPPVAAAVESKRERGL